MSAPKTSTILLILAVVAIVVFFVLGASIGGSGGVSSIKHWVKNQQKPVPMPVADLTVPEGFWMNAWISN